MRSDGGEYVVLTRFFGRRSAPRKRGDFVVFDLETTGLDPTRHEIIEIGAIKVFLGGSNHQSFQAFVQTSRPLPAKIIQITGITDEMLVAADPPRRAMSAFVEVVEDLPLVAFNAAFDQRFREVHAGRHGISLRANKIRDVLELARESLPDLGSHTLQSLVRHFGIDAPVQHRALDDCVCCLKVYDHLLTLPRNQ